MKFLISVIDNVSNSGTPDEMGDVDKFNDSLFANDRFIFAWGLDNPSTTTVIDNRNGANLETGKPFFDSQENISGFWLIDAADAETAHKLAFEASRACNRKVESRKLHDN